MNMMLNLALVAVGSAIGGMARYATGIAVNHFWSGAFPLATFAINVTGSFIIGCLANVLTNIPETTQTTLRLLLIVGVCGGFTTFSSFSLETLNLLRDGQTGIASAYIALSVLLCVGATALGYTVFRS